MDIYDYTKESIKNRMFRRAAALWEIKDLDALDPLVKLLVESLAGEVFLLSRELQDVEDRLIERLASDMAPDIKNTAQPSHAIMQTNITDPELVLSPDSHFNYSNLDPKKHDGLSGLSFSPLGHTRLIGGETVCMIADGDYFSLSGRMGKERAARPFSYSREFSQTLWIGLKLHPNMDTIDEWPVYFDFPYVQDKTTLFQLLPFVRWSVGDNVLSSRQGLPQRAFSSDNQPDSYLDPYSAKRIIEQEIHAFYSHRFLTLSAPVSFGLKNHLALFPEELTDLYDEKITSFSPEPLLWLKAEFPPQFSNEMIQEIYVSLNAFPALNRTRHTIVEKASPSSPYIPLPKPSNHFFLSIDSVSDDYGKIYHEHHPTGTIRPNEGLYSVRKGGTESTNTNRDTASPSQIRAYLHKELNSAMKSRNNGYQQMIANMLQQLHLEGYNDNGQQKPEDAPVYLVVEECETEPRYIEISYWTTAGESGNGIHASETLDLTNNDKLINLTACLLSSSKGGKPPPGPEARSTLFRHALISRDSIYSNEDIRSYCLSVYDEQIADIDIQKGYASNVLPGQGITRTIDIHIEPVGDVTAASLSEMKESLLSGLRLKAPDSFCFRIFFLKAAHDSSADTFKKTTHHAV